MRALMFCAVLVLAVPASADPLLELECSEIEKRIGKLSSVRFHTTRTPLVRQRVPEKNYLWCWNIGFADSGVVIVSYGRDPDSTLFLELYELGERFKWQESR